VGKLRLHYVLSTHWDREWYQPFQDYRYRLVQLLDRVIAGLEEGRLLGPFTADGQAIVLEDYLEVRPERRALVERLAREGHIVIGPWYVLPDEFLVSGESLIRNLRLGREVARAFGAQPSNAGFVCDIFGHNSQLPQIMAGFGVRGGFIWRGINFSTSRLFRWRGADGTELPCYRFGKVGYCSYASQVRKSFEPGRDADQDTLAQRLESYIQEEAEATQVDTLLLFDGGDHQEWDPAAYEVLAERIRAARPDEELMHSTLDRYLDDLLPQVSQIGDVIEGEMREPGRGPVALDQQWLIPGVLSSRVNLKQANAACQTLLCQWAEPLAAFAHAALEREVPQGFLNVAWRWLLKNHPHDSICGCSIDQVHEDMQFRFSQCQRIGERLTIEATQALAANVRGELPDQALRVTVFNPLPRPLSQTAELTLQIPQDWPKFNEFFGFEPKPAFRVYDAEGRELPYQRLAQAMDRRKFRLYDAQFPESYRTDDVRVSLPLHLPALGYTTLTVRPGAPGAPTRHPEAPGLATSERSMANEHLEVSIETNGSLTLTDRRSGQIYTRLLTFEDTADIGDGWYHGVAVNDQTFVSAAGSAQVALVHNGPMLTTFRVQTILLLPAAFDFASMTRSPELVPLVVDALVSLRPGADYVEVEATVHNSVQDHRLRVLLPSGAQADTYLADTPFDVVERPIALRADNHLYRELEVETKPQQSWTAVHDAERGLAVISPGQLETAVRDLPERPIALTLMRSTRRTVMTDGEPGGQLPGTWRFKLAIVLLAGAPAPTRLFELGQQLAAGLRTSQLTAKDVSLRRTTGDLPPTASFLALEGEAVLTSARMVEGALEVRLFNPLPHAIKAALVVPPTYTQAQRVNLESQPLGEAVAVKRGRVAVTMRAKQIITMRLT
jgi:alpha-mannosidase/mannosylglycerate hydrolase